ncbi:hypothetical protein GJ496_009895 [Pomphorhynchus laevis]|nr:hypothetical protein GJ496_009895 [Pomphorhynchus laevis]
MCAKIGGILVYVRNDLHVVNVRRQRDDVLWNEVMWFDIISESSKITIGSIDIEVYFQIFSTEFCQHYINQPVFKLDDVVEGRYFPELVNDLYLSGQSIHKLCDTQSSAKLPTTSQCIR